VSNIQVLGLLGIGSF